MLPIGLVQTSALASGCSETPVDSATLWSLLLQVCCVVCMGCVVCSVMCSVIGLCGVCGLSGVVNRCILSYVCVYTFTCCISLP